MSAVLADTQAVVWALYDTARLSPAAAAALKLAMTTDRLLISVITLVEVNYLAGKKSFPYSGVQQRLLALAADPNERLEVLPLTVEIVAALDLVPKAEVPDMPDRIIAATAVAHKLPLVSADSHIQGSATL
jgi:PIN domain nuclease of toxin-antitoxin system